MKFNIIVGMMAILAVYMMFEWLLTVASECLKFYVR